MVTSHSLRLAAERTCWALGLAGLTWWGAFHLRVAGSAQHDLKRFTELRVTPDQSLWSPTASVPGVRR